MIHHSDLKVYLGCLTCTDGYGEPAAIGWVDATLPLDSWPPCPVCRGLDRIVLECSQALSDVPSGSLPEQAWRTAVILSRLGSLDVFSEWMVLADLTPGEAFNHLLSEDLSIDWSSDLVQWVREWLECDCTGTCYGHDLMERYVDWSALADDVLSDRHVIPGDGGYYIIEDS